MKMATAIVRTTTLERIVKQLEGIGIRGMTISEVKGIGEQVQIDRPYTIHKRIEIIVPDERAEEVANLILDYAYTGFAGDGFVAVGPMDYMVKVRTREKRM